MAFYFALLNVSKKDDRSSGNNNQHRRHHRRHSIASVESPLLDYRLLPRPKLLDNEDVVIPNPVALEEPEAPPPSSTRRSRGSARASKWVQENHQRRGAQNGPSSSRSQGDLHESPKISRSKRMAFPANGGTSSESPKKGKQKPSRLPVRRPTQATTVKLKPCRVHVERALNHHESSATDESRRSSHDSMTPIARREDSPASSCEGASTSMMAKLSLTNNEPRMKKVTFENSPYVISNSFLGDRAVLVRRGSGTAVRLISDAATLPIQTLLCTTTKVLAPHDEVCGDDWWTPCVDVQNHRNSSESPDHVVVDNRANERIEKLQVKNGRRRLLRRRSTSDKRQLLAFRNSGFLDKSQERNGKTSSASSRMTVSVDGTTTLK
ncbi:unnamed protein product [Caenorhabditis angaria]|uniref:Uncharacterized protein n=1 Tax=Caenorhabditis angaria TaxID=860376 RepID=A0A9P1ICR7_9PELO|nr:unnamed protein product [Caenorhabditis angaria]